MLIPEGELVNYLGNDVNSLEGRVTSSILERFKTYDTYTTQEFYLPAIDYLFLGHQQGNKPFKELAKDISISHTTLRRVFGFYGLPILSNKEAIRLSLSRRWQTPEFRERNIEGSRRSLVERRKSPGYNKRQAKVMQRLRQDPLFNQSRIEGLRKALARRWSDPEFRKRHAEIMRINLAQRYLSYLPTIHGYRNDIDFDAQSMWEANISRIFIYLGREFYTREKFRLKVPVEYRNLFNSTETDISIDFVVRDLRGNIVLYEIMAHPLENPEGWVKLDIIARQYSDLNVRIIEDKFYKRLRRYFEERINSDPRFCGWETYKENLKTNPEKFS